MLSITPVKNAFAGIPAPVRQFLLRAVFLFLGWKLLYHSALLQKRLLDGPLTLYNAQHTGWVYQQIYPQSSIQLTQYMSYKHYAEGIPHVALVKDGRKIIGVTDGCNGLEIFVLYAGFLFCIPASWQRRLAFLVGGLLFLYGLNVARVVVLGLLHEHYQSYFDIAHHYIFKLIVYSLVFAGWVWYARKTSLAAHA